MRHMGLSMDMAEKLKASPLAGAQHRAAHAQLLARFWLHRDMQVGCKTKVLTLRDLCPGASQ